MKHQSPSEYERLVKRLADIFSTTPTHIRQHLQRTTMPGSTPLQTARGLLQKVTDYTPRRIANTTRKNKKGLDIPYDALLSVAKAIHRCAKFGRK